uniref:Intraflagellar transport 20 n=1 Tax=Rhinolophus ferrumequinum TaxID=59479 RepID=A0A671G3E5_RHIFE
MEEERLEVCRGSSEAAQQLGEAACHRQPGPQHTATRSAAMAPGILGKVWDPDVTQQTTALQEEGKDPVDRTGQFQKIVAGLLELVDQFTKEAENEKMKADRCSNQNLLKSTAKQKEAQQLQLQALIAEKKMQLERYQDEYEALCKVEAEQNEFIDHFIFQK